MNRLFSTSNQRDDSDITIDKEPEIIFEKASKGTSRDSAIDDPWTKKSHRSDRPMR